MDFSPTPERQMVAESLSRLLAEHLDAEKRRAIAYVAPWHDPTLWAHLCELGVPALLVPAEQGGFGGAGFDITTAFQPLGAALCTEPMLGHAMALAALVALDAPVSEDMVSGNNRFVLAIGEPDVPYGLDDLETTANRAGDGWQITGRKSVVAGAQSATHVLVAARHGDGGIGLFEVSADAIDITAYGMVDGGGAAELFFDATAAQAISLEADAALTTALTAGLLALSAEAVGIAERLVDLTQDYLRTRQQFGRPIGSFQALQHRAAHLWCEMEVTGSAILHAGRMLDSDPDNAAMAVSLAKARAIKTAKLAVIEGVQMHGGIGMTDAFDMGFFMKRARVASEWLGDYGYHAEQVAAARGF